MLRHRLHSCWRMGLQAGKYRLVHKRKGRGKQENCHLWRGRRTTKENQSVETALQHCTVMLQLQGYVRTSHRHKSVPVIGDDNVTLSPAPTFGEGSTFKPPGAR